MKNIFLSGAISTPNAPVATQVGWANNAPNPAAGIPFTQPNADTWNQLIGEILNAVLAAGLTPSATNTSQLTAAIPLLAIGAGASNYSNLIASRALSTNYSNTSGRCLVVSVTCNVTTAGTLIGEVDGVNIAVSYSPASTTNGVFFLVPNGATYNVLFTSGAGTLATWREL